MTRQIVFDTETTGFSFANGDRIIEVGAIELVNRKKTGRVLHFYVDPERDVPDDAVKVHGWDRENLIIQSGGLTFKDRALELYDFFVGAELIAHNAKFDKDFIDGELLRAGIFHEKGINSISDVCMIRDTLDMARSKFPGMRNSLDVLCRRYSIDNSKRDYHGALLDSELLAEVYLAMTQNQVTFELDESNEKKSDVQRPEILFTPIPSEKSSKLRTLQLSTASLEEHGNLSKRISKESKTEYSWGL